MHNYKELKVWNESVDLAVRIYNITETFPDYELYGLTGQMRRAAVSVSSNIAEGAGRSSGKDFSRFLSNALGSLNELETQLIIANKLSYLDTEYTTALEPKTNHIRNMIYKLKQTLN